MITSATRSGDREGLPAGSGPDPSIRNVSETALWVAHYRAEETKRTHAIFRDPYAELLAGGRGAEIARTIPYGQSSGWSMVVRTCVMDELIGRLVKEDGVDAVLNLGAGLDTRPYRLPLPASLRWIEVDLPGILAYKEEKLAGERPVCDLSRVKLDLADAAAARALFGHVAAQAQKVLVLTEGVLVYLNREDVAALAAALHDQPAFAWWLVDITTPALLQWLGKAWGESPGGAGMKFAPEEGPAFFARYGWNAAESRSMALEARRLRREIPRAGLYRFLTLLMPKDRREFYRRLDSFAVLLERA